MRRLLSLTVVLLIFGVAFFSNGCSNNLPALGTVSGKVTLDGNPYPNAQILFSPEAGRPSQGISDENGDYELVFLRDKKGAEIGTHTIRITTLVDAPADPQPDGGRNFKEPIPRKYNTRTTLTREVQAGANSIDFPLESK